METAVETPDRGVGKAIVAAFVCALALKVFCFDFTITDGRSMQPALADGQLLVVNRLAYGFRPHLEARYWLRWSAPSVGDIVVFKTPAGNVAVKRCAGLIQDNKGHTRWLARGDNTPVSLDSRAYGPLPLDAIIGKVTLPWRK
jgi:signal peptidase I